MEARWTEKRLEVLNMITIEQIDEFRRRTNSSYEDAKFFLERHNGDVLEAIIDFEKAKGTWTPQPGTAKKGDFGRRAAEILQKGFDLRMTIEDKQGKLLFTVPVLLLLLLAPVWVMVLIACLGLVFLGYKLGFRDIKSTSVDIKGIFDNLGAQMHDVKHQQAPRAGRPNGPQHAWQPQQPAGGYGTQPSSGGYSPKPPEAPFNPSAAPFNQPAAPFNQPAAQSGQPQTPFGQSGNPFAQPMTQPPTEPWKSAEMSEPSSPGMEKPGSDGYKEYTVE